MKWIENGASTLKWFFFEAFKTYMNNLPQIGISTFIDE